MSITDRLFLATVDFFAGDPRRIQHFTKVHAFARLMGREEGLDERTQLILECAAIVHDTGIRPAEEKYGRNNGALQEQEGPACARRLLEPLGVEPDIVERVCYLVGHHHTYANMDGADYRILVEADFLVNLYEDHESEKAVRAALERIFRTKSGCRLCRAMFGIHD